MFATRSVSFHQLFFVIMAQVEAKQVLYLRTGAGIDLLRDDAFGNMAVADESNGDLHKLTQLLVLDIFSRLDAMTEADMVHNLSDIKAQDELNLTEWQKQHCPTAVNNIKNLLAEMLHLGLIETVSGN